MMYRVRAHNLKNQGAMTFEIIADNGGSGVRKIHPQFQDKLTLTRLMSCEI